MIHEIYSPVIDGWSTLEIVLKESANALDLLRFMTKQIFPEDENYFCETDREKMGKYSLGKGLRL